MNREIVFNIIPDHVHSLNAFRAHNRSLDRASLYARCAVMMPIIVWFFLIVDIAVGNPLNFSLDFFVAVSIACAQLFLAFFALFIVSEFVCE